MPENTSAIVQKVWNYAHVLKNTGVGYGDYVEQITYLLLAPTFGLRATCLAFGSAPQDPEQDRHPLRLRPRLLAGPSLEPFYLLLHAFFRERNRNNPATTRG